MNSAQATRKIQLKNDTFGLVSRPLERNHGSHVMAVAERKGSLSRFLEYYQEQGADTNKIINKYAPKWAGEKSLQRKPRKGKNNI